ncbi:hypothetical protein Acr_00g0104070 [Actinidia rufa]|uniref:Uncharacterized protein n=1 Tax=Actinidia rufa TaxID=165716 RepID=A0A7J0E1H7_9ERIC|nr:hypothetical protein Acr_00g0104070 [Actinidia rufa]
MTFNTLVLLNLACLVTLLLTESTQPHFPCDPSNPQTKSYAFCETSIPIACRVEDLVTRLTVEEKAAQLVNSAPAIPRLDMPAYKWWSEALHGVSSHGKGVRHQLSSDHSHRV